MSSRRQFLWLAATGAVMSGVVTGYLRQRPDGFETRPLKSVPGFRYLQAGPATGGLPDPFIGLDPSTATPEGSLEDLFPVPPRAGEVPVASFSDYNCPYCRVLSKLLAEESAKGGVAVSWHELPLLGEASRTGAKAAIAAGLQGGYLAMHKRLMRSRFRPSETWLVEISGELGLDAQRLLLDMEGPEVNKQLRRSAGLAALFGIAGTPALVVGRTLVLGNIKPADFRRLVELERD